MLSARGPPTVGFAVRFASPGKSKMPNWQGLISTPSSRMARARVDHATPLEELRQRHLAIAAEFLPAPADVAFEPAQLGQLKGEWVRPAGEPPQRLLLYF